LTKNELYPIFLKVSELDVLIVGGGKVAFEKLTFLIKSSPNANAIIVSESFIPEIISSAEKHAIETVNKSYDSSFLQDKHIVIAATDNIEVNLKVYSDCKKRNILVNVADNPDHCDFYMGGIVTKGNVKIAISTNGKSPTMAKRLRQFFEDVLPEDINELTENLNTYRKTIKGNFKEKVKLLNEITKDMINSPGDLNSPGEKRKSPGE